MIVELGANRFIDCRSLLGHRGVDVLAVQLAPLRISLRVPDDAQVTSIAVEDGAVVRGDGVTTSHDERSFAIYAHDVLVAVALLRDRDTVSLKLDLRSLGLHIYDDFEGLHIGTNVFAGNEIRNAAVAIALG